jgi:hypothetical protein
MVSTKKESFMRAHWRLTTSIFAVAALLFAGFGCSDDDGPGATPMVVTAGNHSVEIGKTITLTATTTGGSDTSYTFASGDDAIATVDNNGVVTGVKAGEVIITVTGGDSKAQGTHAVVVISTGGGGGEAVVQISGDSVVELGKTVTLTATTVNGTDASYTWASDTETVATVADGVVTGVAPGTAKITVTGADTTKTATVTIVVSTEVPAMSDWIKGGHAKASAEAFRHWDGDTPAEVPTSCAKCHATGGLMDFLGADGSAAGTIEKAAAPSPGIECKACHNAQASALTSVTFPSGVEVKNLGSEALCMTCHQGRGSSVSVEKVITDAALADDDTVGATLGFQNIHYYPAGATLFGGIAKGGYQYKDKVYDTNFRHAAGLSTCTSCHNPHSLEVKVDLCKDCHTAVTAKADLKKIRMIDSMLDYNGDGKTDGGVYDEINGLGTKLLAAIVAYPTAKSTAKICYDSGAYPYFFKDTDGNGTCETAEANFGNKYDAWTPRLLRAAYNYQMYKKDPGAYAHNAKYIIQLLYDSIIDLNTQLGANAIDMAKAVRNDEGHFNGAGEAARHWDADEAVSASCSKCHSGSDGFRYYLNFGVAKPNATQDNGLDCGTCHEKVGQGGKWDVLKPDDVTFPNGITLTFVAKGDVSNMCANCHSGRENKASVDARIATGKYAFRNVHYLPAAGTLAGSDGQVGYEYATKTYAKTWTHSGGIGCTSCHDPKATNHGFKLTQAVYKTAGQCGATCHSSVANFEDIKKSSRTADYDGSGTAENLKKELAGMAGKLLTQILAAAGTNKICYDSHTYPYWFIDTNGNGSCDGTEASYANGYKSWTPALMKGAFNYQFWIKEPGAWAHNFDYMGQLLFDSIEDLGGATTGMTRP